MLLFTFFLFLLPGTQSETVSNGHSPGTNILRISMHCKALSLQVSEMNTLKISKNIKKELTINQIES